MTVYQDIRIRIVDLAPLSEEFSEPWMPQALRGADAATLAPRLLLGNKSDLAGAATDYAALAELYGGGNLDVFARTIFDLLRIVRVYTKAPSHRAPLPRLRRARWANGGANPFGRGWRYSRIPHLTIQRPRRYGT